MTQLTETKPALSFLSLAVLCVLPRHDRLRLCSQLITVMPVEQHQGNEAKSCLAEELATEPQTRKILPITGDQSKEHPLGIGITRSIQPCV
jgi:hypothetical protein